MKNLIKAIVITPSLPIVFIFMAIVFFKMKKGKTLEEMVSEVESSVENNTPYFENELKILFKRYYPKYVVYAVAMVAYFYLINRFYL